MIAVSGGWVNSTVGTGSLTFRIKSRDVFKTMSEI